MLPWALRIVTGQSFPDAAAREAVDNAALSAADLATATVSIAGLVGVWGWKQNHGIGSHCCRNSRAALAAGPLRSMLPTTRRKPWRAIFILWSA